MTIAEAFSAHETIHKARILKSMFGHLAPEPRKVYTGHIIFSFGCFGDHHIVDTQFDGVCSSPWFFEDVNNFVDEFIQKRGMQGRIYHFCGTYRKYKNGGCCFKGSTKIVKLADAQRS